MVMTDGIFRHEGARLVLYGKSHLHRLAVPIHEARLQAFVEISIQESNGYQK